jgi:hypothetical protein
MKTDFYTGFEGYPSITFTIKAKNVDDIQTQSLKIEIWDGYFNNLMQLIQSNEQGNWDGLALYYHTDTGWYNEENWPLDNVQLAIHQLSAIKFNADSDSMLGTNSNLILEEVRDSLIILLQKAVQQNADVIIQNN